MQTLFREDALAGETALVTGASRGIGASIAAALAAAGARVIGTATSDAGAARIAAALGDSGDGRVVDVADDASVADLFASLSDDPPKIVVNNAGITRDNLLMRMKPEEWDQLIATNLTGVYRVSKAALRAMMKARHGRIISIASVVGAMGNAGQTNYAAAKAGVVGFSKSLAREVGSRGITVNVVAPGYIETDMTAALSDAQRSELGDKIPLARLGQPDDIAAAVVYLASPAGAYVTGETLHVNGGMWVV
ncbi:MAG: 3-oxoacyl-ACP reductase FabG [Pseudomonadota bacterium]